MAKQPVLHIIGVSCPPDLEDKFNQWYNETHAPDMLKSGKVRRAARYRMIDTEATLKSDGMPVPYMAIYEFDSKEDFEEFQASPLHIALIADAREMWPEWENMRRFRAQYEAVKTWQR